MERHSFIQVQKLSDVKGRINYITSHERQENLYAVYQTETGGFWESLAKENREEFKKSGSGGTCIEAREFIIALPEVYTTYDPRQVLELFTESFKEKYVVECVSALHHNKKKTNYHIHLIFSERKLLEQPEIKIAERNRFYNEDGKHVRTKKEIMDSDGNLKNGCKIIKKGEVYEQRLFTNKNRYFKSETFLEKEKIRYTNLINEYIENPLEKLQVFDKDGVYLPTKKIGKNNPKAEDIQADNTIRTEWNHTVDMALIEGIEEEAIQNIKKEEISKRVVQSIKIYGKLPELFRKIVLKAKELLQSIIRKFISPPKPELRIDIYEFRRMENIKGELDRQIQAIKQVEKTGMPYLQEQLNEAKGIFKGKERKGIEQQIAEMEGRLRNMKDYLTQIVSRYGYANVQEFMEVYRKSSDEIQRYNEQIEKWKQKKGGEQIKDSIEDKLRQYETEIKSRQYSRSRRGSEGGR